MAGDGPRVVGRYVSPAFGPSLMHLGPTSPVQGVSVGSVPRGSLRYPSPMVVRRSVERSVFGAMPAPMSARDVSVGPVVQGPNRYPPVMVVRRYVASLAVDFFASVSPLPMKVKGRVSFEGRAAAAAGTISREGPHLVLRDWGVRPESTFALDAEDALARLAEAHGVPIGEEDVSDGLDRDEGVEITVALVPRPDNTYNPNAVSVALPDASVPIEERHLGYLYDGDLAYLGWRTIPRLTEVVRGEGGEVHCRAVLSAGLDLGVLIDVGDVREAAEDLLRGVDATFTSDELDVDVRAAEMTAAVLELVASPEDPPEPVDDIVLTSEPGWGVTLDTLVISHTDGDWVGNVDADRNLVLKDERHRERVLELLSDLGVPVSGMQPLPAEADARVAPQHLRVHAFAEDGVTIEPDRELPYERRLGKSIGCLNRHTGILSVEDRALVPVVAAFAARAGLPVTSVRAARVAWQLDDEFSQVELLGREGFVVDELPELPPRKPVVLERHRGVLPGTLLDDDVTFVRPPVRGREDLDDDLFLAHERVRTPRGLLFGEHTLHGWVADCRLCGQRAAVFTTPLSRDRLAYCHPCLARAVRGMGTGREVTARAVAELAELEFGGVAVVPSQLSRLHLGVDATRPGGDIDALLLLRFAVGRGHPWTRVLIEAGLAKDGLRTRRGTIVEAMDGHLCLSLQEKVVCEFLHVNGIEHDREPHYPVDPELNPRGRQRADWKLADGTLVEMWGMPDDPAYAAKMRAKQALAVKHGLEVVELTSADLPRLPERFARWVSGPQKRWSPPTT